MNTKYVYTFSQDNEPVLTVDPGVLIKLKTLDCFGNQIKSGDQLVTNIDYSHTNPATGPLFVNGAEPGDVLVVDIASIDVADYGFVAIYPEIGPLHDKCELRTKMVKIQNEKALFNDIEIPIKPMIGVIGVAPEAGVTVPTGFPGPHGGNLDCKHIVAGSRLYLPVRAGGALFQLGDLHAVMGDGELCGTGLEIAGEVGVIFSTIKNYSLDNPVLEIEDKWYVMGCDAEYPQALKKAAETMQRLLVNAYGWDETDAYLYMSLDSDVEICQACKPCAVPLIVRLGVPKLKNKSPLILLPE